MTNEPRFEVLDLVSIALLGPWWWHTEDMSEAGAVGAVFRCYQQGDENELGYLLVADVRPILGEESISFLMLDGPTEVVCEISCETLTRLGRVRALTELSKIFETSRDRCCFCRPIFANSVPSASHSHAAWQHEPESFLADGPSR
jgi:hypothetical protein